MRPAYAYLGIGIVFFLAVLAFTNHGLLSPPRNDDNVNVPLEPIATTSVFSLSSSAFTEGASIPTKYTCDASQISPPLSISGAPEGTKSFVLIVEDPDVPKQFKPDGVFLHWLVFNIPVATTNIPEGTSIGVSGANGAGKSAYVGPCPPKEYQPNEHRYIFTLYALDTELSLKAGAQKDSLVSAMQGHILAQTQLMAKYKKI